MMQGKKISPGAGGSQGDVPARGVLSNHFDFLVYNWTKWIYVHPESKVSISLRAGDLWKVQRKMKYLMNSIIRLDHWLEEHDFKGYEPRDGLSSKLTPLAFQNWFAKRVLQQLVLRCPFHIRPLIGVKPRMSLIGMGFLARGYIRMWNIDQELIWKKRAICHI